MLSKVMTRRAFLRATGVTTGAAIGGLTGCAPPSVPLPSAAPPPPVHSFGLQEAWRNNGENAPFHVCLKAGYFGDEGLDVTLVEGGPGIPAHINVLRGDVAEIGCIASVGVVIPWVSEGLPFVMTGAIFQKHPLGFVTLESKLTDEQRTRPLTPEDMRGKRVGVQADYELIALLQKNGMSADDVTIVNIAGENPSDLLTNTVDFASYWVVNQPLTLEEPWKALMFADWAVPLYADVLITTVERLEKEPEVMRAFLRALKRGMQRAIDDPEFAFEASMEFSGGYDTEPILRKRIALQNQMMVSDDTEEHGLCWMDLAKVEEAVNFFAEQKQIRNVPETSVIATTEYL